MPVSLSRLSALAAVLALALLPASAQSPRIGDTTHRLQIRAQAIESFDPREPERRRFGVLSFRGGLILESTHPDFGGLSGLTLEPDGQRFIALSDKANWLRGRIVYRGSTPIAITDAEMAPMLGPDGRPLRRRGWYDTEALTEDRGTLYVGIERVHQIVRFDYARDGLRAKAQPLPVPPLMKTLPANQGIECIAPGPKTGPAAGSLIAISERGLDRSGNILGFLIGGAGGTFSLRRTDDFDVSDCAATPDGRLIVLERRFSWIRGLAVRMRILPMSSIKPGALVDGAELMSADMASQIDNMEGLAIHRAGDGSLVLTLVSDDNFSPLQRTVLLQFALPGE